MGRKILIIDDDKVTRKVVGQALNGFDCQLLEAADGAEGLMIAQHERPELILLDYNMPVMDGPKTLAKLKTDPELRTLPVLMLTAESSRESVVRAVKLGVCGYLVKPFRAAELVERISRVLALEPRNPLAPQTKRFDAALQILVVDDKPVIVQQIQEALAGTGWRVHGVSDPDQAADSCSQTPPDILLVSLSLAEDGAFSLFQTLRAAARTQNIPVFALSVKTAIDEQNRAQQLGFNGVVTKPIDFTTLRARITRTLNLDTSTHYFELTNRMLLLTLPANFTSSVANDISGRLGNKLCEAVDGGLNRFIMDLSRLESIEVPLIRLGLQVIQLCTELEMRYALVGSDAVCRECRNYAEIKDWQFCGSLDEALTMLDDQTTIMA